MAKSSQDIERPHDYTVPGKNDFDVGVSGDVDDKGKGDVDVAAGFLAQLDPSVKEAPISDKEARKVLWKIDLSILPILSISVIIAAVDKVVISNAAIYGMKADTHLKDNEYSWVGR